MAIVIRNTGDYWFVDGLLKFPVVHEPIPNKMKPGEMQYLCSIILNEAKDRAIFQEFRKKFSIKKNITCDRDNDEIFTFSRRTVFADGTPLPPPVVRDAHNQDIPKEVLIGNGSRGTLCFKVAEYDNAFGKGGMVTFVGIKVLELVPYTKPPEKDPFGSDETPPAQQAAPKRNFVADEGIPF